jgi:glycosyltransferase involved in cell wall biosynthesis
MARVSVIIPNYNHTVYLKQRIDSVLNQTYRDFEVIILDDCSTDNSIEIIEQYRNNEKIVHIVLNDANSGSTFKQWDKGIQLAKGEYIWLAESDDWCENNFLQVIVDGLEKNKEAVFGYCQSFCINDEGLIIFQSSYTKLEDYCPANEYLEKFLCFGNAVFNASMAVFRKDFYYKVSDFYKTFKFTGDWVFWAELSRLSPVYVNARPLNYFRKHDNDVSGKIYASGLNFIEELKVLNYFHERLGLNGSQYLKAKIRLYNRFIAGESRIDHTLKEQTRALFFAKVSFFQKQQFLILSSLYLLKSNLNRRINRPLRTS